MSPELIVLVNDQGQPIGAAPKLESHNENTPLHLAFSCYVFNQKGEFLLTQRAKSKKVFPGVWTNSCCGHPAPGETTEDAVNRRLKEELGLVPDTLQLAVPEFRYRAEMNGIVENEICPVYVAYVQKEPQLNPDEVEEYKWLNWKKFLKNIENHPDDYSPWSVLQTAALEEAHIVIKAEG